MSENIEARLARIEAQQAETLRILRMIAKDSPSYTEHTGWKAVRVPDWSKYDGGIPLGDLGEKGLAYWLSWQPKGFRGKPASEQDLAFREALDQADDEIKAGTYTPPKFTKKPRSPKTGDNSSSNSSRRDEATPPANHDINDEDVPF